MENLNPFTKEREYLEQELLARSAKNTYLDYIRLTNIDFVDTKLHTFLADKIQKFIDTPTAAVSILLLSVPPQHGKSMSITETLPSWYLLKNPNHGVLVASYNEDFAIKFGRANKQKIEEYGALINPEVKLNPEHRSNQTWGFKKYRGECNSRGLTSGITGNKAHLIIIDDPIKNKEEAFSANQRDKIWGEYKASVLSRTQANSKLIVIQTRWHEDDLYGRIKASVPDAEVINIPVECLDPANDPLGRSLGDALLPEIGKDNIWMTEFKKNFQDDEGESTWVALFMGSPTIKGGNLFKKDYWKYYEELETDMPIMVMSVDAAFKETSDSDYVAIQVWGKRHKNYYLVDLLKRRMGFKDTLDAIRGFKAKYPAVDYILIEDKANGPAIVDVLSSEIDGVLPVQPRGGKIARARAVEHIPQAGRVFLPRFGGMAIDDFVEELAKFPNAANDDQVDAFTQMLNWLHYTSADITREKSYKKAEWSDDQFEDYRNAPDKEKEYLLSIWGMPLNWESVDEY